jgi:GNAT superfamily N-acetyltransferase
LADARRAAASAAAAQARPRRHAERPATAPTVEILPATAATWDALADLFANRGGPDTRFCWCIWWRARSKDFSNATLAANRERLRGLVDAGPPPGLVAFEDGRAVGWVALAPRPEYLRLEHSRVIPRLDGPVPWAIPCFVVSTDSRGRGIAAALLAAAVAHARAAGAPALEGYPIDPSAVPGGPVRDTGAYTGTRAMFERAGFRPAAPTTSHGGGVPRVVMRLDLA